LRAAIDAIPGTSALVTSKAYINLIRPKAKPIKTKAQQNNPENSEPTYLIRIFKSSPGVVGFALSLAFFNVRANCDVQ